MKSKKAMEFANFFVMFLIIGLFVFCIISFAISFGNENEASVNLNQNPTLNKLYKNINTTLESSSKNVSDTKKALEQEYSNPVITTLGFVFTSILTAGKIFSNMGIDTISYVFIFAQETLSIPPVITGTLMAILVGLLVLGIWSVIRSGK